MIFTIIIFWLMIFWIEQSQEQIFNLSKIINLMTFQKQQQTPLSEAYWMKLFRFPLRLNFANSCGNPISKPDFPQYWKDEAKMSSTLGRSWTLIANRDAVALNDVELIDMEALRGISIKLWIS